MIVFQSDKQRICFFIKGYEYLDSEDPYDKNWLIVQIQVKKGCRNFSVEEPMLQTSELFSLKKWFLSPSHRLEFLEPTVVFLKSRIKPDVWAFELVFSEATACGGALDLDLEKDGYHFKMMVDDVAFELAAKQIGELISRWPMRL